MVDLAEVDESWEFFSSKVIAEADDENKSSKNFITVLRFF